MPVFETADELYTCIGGLFERMQSHPEAQEMLKQVKSTVRFTYTEPAASITLVAGDGGPSLHYGECDQTPDVELGMTGDVAHHFWLGEINVMGAITRRQIIPIGPLSKLMTLTPLIKVAVRMYPQHFQEFLSKRDA